VPRDIEALVFTPSPKSTLDRSEPALFGLKPATPDMALQVNIGNYPNAGSLLECTSEAADKRLLADGGTIRRQTVRAARKLKLNFKQEVQRSFIKLTLPNHAKLPSSLRTIWSSSAALRHVKA
jgi:hypothetical protein